MIKMKTIEGAVEEVAESRAALNAIVDTIVDRVGEERWDAIATEAIEHLLEGSPIMQSRKDALAAGESTEYIDKTLDMLNDLMSPDVIKLAELWNIS